MHNDVLSAFSEKLYSNVFTEENIASPKKALVVGETKHYGYFLEKGKDKYFAVAGYTDELPFKVDEYTELDYKTDVYRFVNHITSIVIPATQKFSFRFLVDSSPAFKHSNMMHWTIYKIMNIASTVDRVNYRAVSAAGFGKDSATVVTSTLVDSTANLCGATFAKLEYALKNRKIILNEMGNMKKDDIAMMQEFLLATGAYFNTYTKRSRKTALTQETYDISKTSLLIFHNLPSYYIAKGQEYFDQMFTSAVINRFIPFLFDGYITTKFDVPIDKNAMADKYDTHLKDTIATINYFKTNPIIRIKYRIPDVITFSEELNRYERSFNTILKYIGEYCISQEEFNIMAVETFKCYKAYIDLMDKNRLLPKDIKSGIKLM